MFYNNDPEVGIFSELTAITKTPFLLYPLVISRNNCEILIPYEILIPFFVL